MTFSGEIRGANSAIEIWSFSLKSQPQVPGPLPQADLVTAAGKGFDAYALNVRGLMPSWVRLTNVRCSNHDAGGATARNADQGYQQADRAVTGATGEGQSAGGFKMPLQSALCVSLDTGFPGASGRGRVFLPFPGFPLDPDHSLSIANATAMATSMSELIRDLRTSPFGEARVISSKGAASLVLSVRVGRIPDTQRSRRSALVEGHIRKTIPA
jgi:hypothetical protein